MQPPLVHHLNARDERLGAKLSACMPTAEGSIGSRMEFSFDGSSICSLGPWREGQELFWDINGWRPARGASCTMDFRKES